MLPLPCKLSGAATSGRQEETWQETTPNFRTKGLSWQQLKLYKELHFMNRQEHLNSHAKSIAELRGI